MRKVCLFIAAASAVRVLEEPKAPAVDANSTNCSNTTIPFFKASDSGKENSTYTRVVPETFGDNMLHTIIKQFAIETKMSDGKPSGKFYLN